MKNLRRANTAMLVWMDGSRLSRLDITVFTLPQPTADPGDQSEDTA